MERGRGRGSMFLSEGAEHEHREERASREGQAGNNENQAGQSSRQGAT